LIEQYADIADIEKLKQLVAQSQMDSKFDTQLRSFIEIKSNKTTENTNKIIQQVNELQQYRESFSVE